MTETNEKDKRQMTKEKNTFTFFIIKGQYRKSNEIKFHVIVRGEQRNVKLMYE